MEHFIPGVVCRDPLARFAILPEKPGEVQASGEDEDAALRAAEVFFQSNDDQAIDSMKEIVDGQLSRMDVARRVLHHTI